MVSIGYQNICLPVQRLTVCVSISVSVDAANEVVRVTVLAFQDVSRVIRNPVGLNELTGSLFDDCGSTAR